MCLSLAGCGKKKTDPEPLATPSVTIATDGKASWAPVENASGYAYKINNGEEKDTTETSVTLTNGQSIVVKAVGDGENYLDSSWSTSKTYTAPSSGNTENPPSGGTENPPSGGTENPPSGGTENPPSGGNTHTCGHVCQVTGCGKCTDNTCDKPECTSKCPGHGSDVTPSSNYGTQDNPLSISEALALADKECVADGDFTKQYVYATGKVSNVPTKNSSEAFYRNVTLADLTDSSKTILVFTVNVDADVAAPAQNDTLVIYGYIKNHQGTIEFAGNGSNYVYVKENTRGTSTISLGEHDGADVTGLPGTKTNGETVEFTVTPQSGRAIDAVKVYGEPATEVDAAAGKYSFVVAGDATVVVETRDASTAAAEELITLDFGVDKSTQSDWVNNYASTFTASQDGVTWSVTNFNNGASDNDPHWGHVRTGHSKNALKSSIATDVAWADTVTKVVVNVSQLQSADKVNSFRLEVSSNGNFEQADIVETVPVTIAQGNNEFKIVNPVANHYYRIVLDCQAIGGSTNGVIRISSVTYWGHLAESGSIKDPDTVNASKVAVAKKALTLTPAQYSTIETDVQLDNTSGDVALTWTVKNSADTEWVVINNNVLDILKLPDADEKEIVINVHLSLGKAEDDKELTLTLVASNAKGTLNNPYTVAEAVAEAKKLSSTDWSAAVYATGYVIDLGTWYTDHWGSVIIADSLTSAKGKDDAIILYNLYPDYTYLSVKDDLVIGATITVYGYMKNYNGTTPEFDTNNSLQPKAVAYTGPTDETKVAFAAEALSLPSPNIEADKYTYNLPLTGAHGTTVSWLISGIDASGYTYTADTGVLVVTRQDAEVKFTATATIKSGETASTTKSFENVTVKAKPAEGAEDLVPGMAAELDMTAGWKNVNMPTGSSGYTGTAAWTADGTTADGTNSTWSLFAFNNNNKGWSYVKGGSNSKATSPYISVTISYTVTHLSIGLVSFTANQIDSANLEIKNGEQAVATISIKDQFVANAKTIELDIDSAYQGTGYTYIIAFELAKTSSNGTAVQINKVTYTGLVPANGGGTGGGTTDPDNPGPGPGDDISSPVTFTFSTKYAANTTLDGTAITVNSLITLTFAKGSGGTAPQYYTSGTAVRWYGGNTLTVNAGSYKITKITLVFGNSDGTNAITATGGSFTSPEWTGSASSVVFTVGGSSGNRRLAGITIEFEE